MAYFHFGKSVRSHCQAHACQVPHVDAESPQPQGNVVLRHEKTVISGNSAITAIMVFTAILSAANGLHPMNDAESEGKGANQMDANSTA